MPCTINKQGEEHQEKRLDVAMSIGGRAAGTLRLNIRIHKRDYDYSAVVGRATSSNPPAGKREAPSPPIPSRAIHHPTGRPGRSHLSSSGAPATSAEALTTDDDDETTAGGLVVG